MSQSNLPQRLTWLQKFACAFRGLFVALRRENSFAVHVPVAFAVIAAAAFFRVQVGEWIALVLCISVVITAELLNTALEDMAKAVTTEFHPHVRNALDIASGGVLAACFGAAIIGLIIFVPRVLALVGVLS